MALLADTRGAKLTKMLSEANQQNWFLKRQVSTHTHIVYIVFVPNYRWIIGKKMVREKEKRKNDVTLMCY